MPNNGAKNPKSRPCLGFLTVIEHPQDGLFGGYLALDFRGRPLEFRCTAPIKPNRAQQILYGSTLNHYLYGELIGRTLLEGSKLPPLVVCTDLTSVLAVRDFVDMPVAVVESQSTQQPTSKTSSTETSSSTADSSTKTWQVHASHEQETRLNHFHWGRNRLATSADVELDQQTVTERLAPLADSFDLTEPFVRIREAIEEARCAGG